MRYKITSLYIEVSLNYVNDRSAFDGEQTYQKKWSMKEETGRKLKHAILQHRTSARAFSIKLIVFICTFFHLPSTKTLGVRVINSLKKRLVWGGCILNN